ncbi:FAD-binding domain-containing protein [Rostrohypoxylon terebratum]|nr:FAD-binding domain-containing protein [Rostrohypoxylon terebratum]
MALRGLFGLISLVVVIVAVTLNYRGSQQCRVIPGDQSWPSLEHWNDLNQTIHGKLIASVPLAAPCHYTSEGTSEGATTFNQDRCDALRDEWFFPTTHLGSPSSPMAYQFTNDSCNPFTDPDLPCTLGYHVAYTVNATEIEDFQAALQFVKRHNIRLVIRNTGHDYLGKSTGAHALAVWTRHLKSLELIPKYHDSGYQGAAIKVGAGVEFLELYQFASSNGLMVAGGNCPNVGPAGGYAQGGGIGILSSKFGLAADNVLSWEAVTAAGDHITASATENTDLYWALRGGGGGTYAIVTSMTVKAYPDTTFSTVYLSAFDDGSNTDAIYSVMGTFLQALPTLVDAGAWLVFVVAPFGFLVMPAMVADLKASELDAYFQSTREKMDQLGLQYQYQSADYPSFLQSYQSMTSTWNVSDFNMGGRLIPRELAKDQESTDSLVKAIRAIATKTLTIGVAFNVAKGVSSPDEVAVNPYFRKTLFNAVIGTPINYTNFASNKEAQDAITNTFLPELEAITPNGGVYMNEADFQAPDFKTTFYGGNYKKLLAIKNKYDPDHIFYAKTAVGSDRWEQRIDGRLCSKGRAIWEQYIPGFLR